MLWNSEKLLMSTLNPGAVAVGYGFTALLHTGIFFAASKALEGAGVAPDLSWGQSGVIAIGYVTSKAWMSALTRSNE